MSRSRGGRSFTTRSPIATSPLVMSSSPAIIRKAVVFPQPDGPTRQTNSPSAMSRSRRSTARPFAPGYRFVRLLNETRATEPSLLGRSSFHRAGEHAAHEVALEREEDDERDDDRDHRARRDDPVVGGERACLVVQEDRERLMDVAPEEDERHEEVVPDPDELEDRQRRSRRKAERQHDLVEQLPLAGALDARRLQQVAWYPDEEVPHQEDAEREPEGDVEEDDARDRPEGIETRHVPEVVVQLHDRDQPHLEGHDHQRHDA